VLSITTLKVLNILSAKLDQQFFFKRAQYFISKISSPLLYKNMLNILSAKPAQHYSIKP